MEKNKCYKSTLLFILLSFCFLCLSGCSSDSNYLIIKNNSGNLVTDVKIEYSNLEQITLGSLHNHTEYKFKLLDSANEKAIHLIYTDNHNDVHKLLVIPYLVLAENKNYRHQID